MLTDCPRVWGYSTILEPDPRIETHHDVLFVPGGKGGLFDRGRRLIAGSGYYRGLPSALGIVDLVHGSVFSPIDPDEVTEWHETSVVFGGVLIDHFGHFLVGTLARWWNWKARGKRQYVVINGCDLSGALNLPIYRAILPVLGFDASDFITFDRPIRMREVVVEYPSFEENNLAHLVFGRLCGEISTAVLPNVPQSNAPVFLSKSKMKSGITRVDNEGALCNKLEARGIKIVSPEDLSLADQISLFKSSPAISGFMGSAFHTSAFASGSNLMAINHSPEIISNQVMIDKVCSNHARYVFDPEMFTAFGQKDGFHKTFVMNDVDRAYTEVMRFYEQYL